jgi:hypothetical protein
MIGWLAMISLLGIRAAVMKERLSRKDIGRDWNAILPSGTEIQDSSYIRGRLANRIGS